MDKRRADQIADVLEQQILEGEYPDGTRLDEIRLAHRFGVSRTPLREAFQKLMLTGLVEQVPRRGVFVRQPGPVELMEMFEVMAELEATCARLAAIRISDQALALLRSTNANCKRAVENSDVDSYFFDNERFHQAIYRQSGNGFLESETLRVHKRLRPYRRIQLKLKGRLAQSMAEHEAIVDALANGDSEAAANTIRQHVAVQGEKFHHLLTNLRAKQGMDAAPA